MPDRILIVDASPLIYAVYDTQGHLSTSQGVSTGLRYGFLRSIRSYQNKTKTNKVAIVFDSPGQVIKAAGAEHYKANRVMTDDKIRMYSQVPDLKKMLGFTKWTLIEAPGYEADDVIANVARAKASHGHECVVVSADNDLLQLIAPRVYVWRPGSKRHGTKDGYIDVSMVKEIFGVHPAHLLLYRAFVGDVSDNLPGVVTSSEGKRQLAQALQACFPSERPVTLDDLAECLSEFNLHSTVCLGGIPETVQQNYQIMSLHKPPQLTITKGARDKEALDALFRELEFRSMFQYIDELTGNDN